MLGEIFSYTCNTFYVFIHKISNLKKMTQCQVGRFHGYFHNIILDSRNPLWSPPKCSQRWLGHHHLPSLTLYWLHVTLGIKAQVHNKVSCALPLSSQAHPPILHKRHLPSCLPNSHRALLQPQKSQVIDRFLLQSCRHIEFIVSVTLGSFLHNPYQ